MFNNFQIYLSHGLPCLFNKTAAPSSCFSLPFTWREKVVCLESVYGSLYRARDSTDGRRSFQKTNNVCGFNIKVAMGAIHDT